MVSWEHIRFARGKQERNEGGDLAPLGAWIVRYQARGRRGAYWYYKWQSHEAIFKTKEAKSLVINILAFAGSPAYLKAQDLRKDTRYRV